MALSDFNKNVAIVVNVASQCGYTDVHYRELEQLYKKYKDRGFTVLAFPCNQFGNQEPGTPAEIEKFARQTKHATFPLFEKVNVNGKDAHPIYQFLKSHSNGLLGGGIKWNFTKFLIAPDGKSIKRYAPSTAPEDIRSDIKSLISK